MSHQLGLEIVRHCRTKLPKNFTADVWGIVPKYRKALEHLHWMCEEMENNSEDWPVSKLHRWIGYVQGQMVLMGITDLETEKDVVRELKKQFADD